MKKILLVTLFLCGVTLSVEAQVKSVKEAALQAKEACEVSDQKVKIGSGKSSIKYENCSTSQEYNKGEQRNTNFEGDVNASVGVIGGDVRGSQNTQGAQNNTSTKNTNCTTGELYFECVDKEKK